MRSRKRLVDAESRLPVGSSARRILRVVGQRPGNRHPLALAAGQLRGQTVLTSRKVNLGQELAGPEFSLTTRTVSSEHGHLHVGEGAELGQQVVELEDEPNLVPPVAAEVTDLSQILTAHDDRTRGGGVDGGQEVEQR